MSGADVITVHQEVGPHLHRSLQEIKRLGTKSGVALCPATHESSFEYALDDRDLTLVMTVNSRFRGQSFIEGHLEKVRRVHEMIRSQPIRVESDGGANPEIAPKVTRAGADTIEVGFAVFMGGAPDAYRANIAAIRAAATAGSVVT